MLLANEWKDYELIDTGNGEKLERWGSVILRRPDPQIIWPIKNEKSWKKIAQIGNYSQLEAACCQTITWCYF